MARERRRCGRYTRSLRDQLRNSSVSVVEIVPPLVQTALQRAAGFNPKGMPLNDYVAATLEQLVAEREVTEIIIDAVKPLRHAEREGRFDTVFRQINPA